MAKLIMPSTVVLELTSDEATILARLLAGISGKGPVRAATDTIYAALSPFDDGSSLFTGNLRSVEKE